jgi:aspartate/methionine/tyrosine aminotransferase
MEMGVPGLEPSEVGTRAEIASLEKGVASKYPPIEGLPSFKKEISRFAKNFLDIQVSPACCVPSVGSMQGGMALFMVACRRDPAKTKTLFIDPGFPVQKQQHHVLGLDYEHFDVYDYRGDKLRAKLESYLQKGDISTILYSNPNNPSWICFTEKELQIIGELATRYEVVVVEDLAYFAMDFRSDYSVPGKPPYQPTVAKYTDYYALLISSSKAFSYAGQRMGMILVSDFLFYKQFEGLKRFFANDVFGPAMIYGALYALSAGTGHSPQYAVEAMLKAANEGQFNFIEEVKSYGERAAFMKDVLVNNGFQIVYDKDEDKPLADGFYFTFAYPGFTGVELVEELLYYGISAIALDITGSERQEGLRACVSLIDEQGSRDFKERVEIFREDHK